MKRRTQSIILRRIAYGEADWIVTFFSRGEGRMSGIAKSARHSMRRFGGALEPGTLVSLSYAERDASQLVRIEEALVERHTNGIVKSLERIAAMSRALELALAFLQERQPAPEKFDLLDARLDALTRNDPGISDTMTFELAWLARSGFGPNLAGCASCGGDGTEGGAWTFDFEQGGVICPDCAAAPGGKVQLTAGAIDLLRRPHEAGCVDDRDSALLAGRALGEYIDHIIGRPMRTMSDGYMKR